MRVFGYVPDLMDRSRWSAVTHVQEPARLGSVDADLVVVDLDRLDSLSVLADIAAPTLGFCSHVHDQLRADALAAGCDEVVPRSRMARALAERIAPPSAAPESEPAGTPPSVASEPPRTGPEAGR